MTYSTRKPYNLADDDYDVVCPNCGKRERQIKIGKMPSGSQRFKCQYCKKKYVPKGRQYKDPVSWLEELLKKYK